MTVHTEPAAPPAAARTVPAARTRITGAALAVGTSAWIAGLTTAGKDFEDGKVVPLEIWAGMVFLFGLFPFVALLRATGAAGPRKGRVLCAVEMALLVPAMVWCPLAVAAGDGEEPAWMIPFDLCWPLSMALMLAVGICVAVTGRFRGPLRWLPLLCGLWLPVAGAGQGMLEGAAGTVPGAAWLGLTYGLTGLLLAAAPRLTDPA
ncbi:hypothetical protein [Spirillospora albida]|uniref:hypothetical protein n=1 Tax=Spirillospora albida TaxID=58123 RepID=UPI0004C09571|nr:hypothetical protein [Spirillospora albida]